MQRLAAVLFLLAARAAAFAACQPPTAVPPIPPAQVAATLFLVGDAGLHNNNCQGRTLCNDPVLQMLERHVRQRAAEQGPDKIAVVFLGDNIYPRGLPAASGSERKEGIARLAAQVDVVRATGVQGWFVPGNHDWNQNDVGGFVRIKSEAAQLDGVTDARVAMRPRRGCPGPETETVNGALSIVFVDTAWWLQPAADRPVPPECPTGTEANAMSALRDALRPLDARRTVIVSHHPFEKSVGQHGTQGHGKQDFANSENRRMRLKLQQAVADSGIRPLMWAAGHDHSLQLLRGDKVGFDVVSGLGFRRSSTGVTCAADVVYASERPGYMVLDVPIDPAAAPRIEVRELNGPATSFSMRLP
jgi:hypothetical protein